MYARQAVMTAMITLRAHAITSKNDLALHEESRQCPTAFVGSSRWDSSACKTPCGAEAPLAPGSSCGCVFVRKCVTRSLPRFAYCAQAYMHRSPGQRGAKTPKDRQLWGHQRPLAPGGKCRCTYIYICVSRGYYRCVSHCMRTCMQGSPRTGMRFVRRSGTLAPQQVYTSYTKP